MDLLPNHHKLTRPEWVHALTHDNGGPGRADQGFVLIEAGAGARAGYAEGHIPGAIYFDTNAIERAPLWNLLPAGELEAALVAHGITYDKTIVLYSKMSSAAARVALALMCAGVDDVRLLDGGIEAWTMAGYPLETAARHPLPVEGFGLKAPAHPEYLIDLAGAQALLDDPNGLLVDVRNWDEHSGERSGYDYIQARGRIPGSVWAGISGSGVSYLEGYRNADQTLRDLRQIAEMWRARGITPDKKVAFYCGTGWRASEAFFYAHVMGWREISVYDGGWLEWSGGQGNRT